MPAGGISKKTSPVNGTWTTISIPRIPKAVAESGLSAARWCESSGTGQRLRMSIAGNSSGEA